MSTIFNNIDPNSIPPYFKCPISHKVFDTPVVAEDGHSYEKAEWEKLINETTDERITSPVSGYPIGKKAYINRELKSFMYIWADRMREMSDFAIAVERYESLSGPVHM